MGENKYTLLWLDAHTLGINNRNMELVATCSRVINEKLETSGIYPHNHMFFELHYVMQGQIVFLLDKKQRITVDQNHFLIIPPGREHKAETIYEDTIKYVLGFYIKPYESLPKEAIRLIQKNPYTVYHANDSTKDLVTMMWSNACKLQPLTPLMLERLLECFIIEVFRIVVPLNISQDRLPCMLDNDIRIEQMTAYITQNIHQTLTVKEIAAKLNICDRHLNRIIKKHFGITVKDFIDQKKIELIKHQLVSTSATIPQIATSCGFSSTDAMIRFFKKEENCSPQEYRLKNKNCSSI